MGRRPGSHHQSHALAALLVFALSGCANTAWHASSGGPPPSPSAGGSVSVYGSSDVGALLVLGILAGAVYGPSAYGAPPMDPNRRVVEQDCAKPIEDPSANLRCK